MTIGNLVTEIGFHAFYNCSGLKTLTIGASVKTIGDKAFYNCTKLNRIISLIITPPAVENDPFSGIDFIGCKLKVNSRAISEYEKSDFWKNFWNIEAISDSDLDLTPDNEKFDVNGDNKVNTADVVAIYNFILNGK